MGSLLLFLSLCCFALLTEANHIQTKTLNGHYKHLQSLCYDCQLKCRIEKTGADCVKCLKVYTKDICQRFDEPKALYSIHWQKFSKFESVCAVCKAYCWHQDDNGSDPCGACKDVRREPCEDWLENGGPDNKPRSKAQYDAENKRHCDECDQKNCRIGQPGYSNDDCGYCDNIWPEYTCKSVNDEDKNIFKCFECDENCRGGVRNHVGKEDYECIACELWLAPDFCAPLSAIARERIRKNDISETKTGSAEIESEEVLNFLPTEPLISPQHYDRWEINCRTCYKYCRVNVKEHHGVDGTDCSNCEQRFTEERCVKFYKKNYVVLDNGEYESGEMKSAMDMLEVEGYQHKKESCEMCKKYCWYHARPGPLCGGCDTIHSKGNCTEEKLIEANATASRISSNTYADIQYRCGACREICIDKFYASEEKQAVCDVCDNTFSAKKCEHFSSEAIQAPMFIRKMSCRRCWEYCSASSQTAHDEMVNHYMCFACRPFHLDPTTDRLSCDKNITAAHMTHEEKMLWLSPLLVASVESDVIAYNNRMLTLRKYTCAACRLGCIPGKKYEEQLERDRCNYCEEHLSPKDCQEAMDFEITDPLKEVRAMSCLSCVENCANDASRTSQMQFHAHFFCYACTPLFADADGKVECTLTDEEIITANWIGSNVLPSASSNQSLHSIEWHWATRKYACGACRKMCLPDNLYGNATKQSICDHCRDYLSSKQCSDVDAFKVEDVPQVVDKLNCSSCSQFCRSEPADAWDQFRAHFFCTGCQPLFLLPGTGKFDCPKEEDHLGPHNCGRLRRWCARTCANHTADGTSCDYCPMYTLICNWYYTWTENRFVEKPLQLNKPRI